ncbi:MAG: hypothetical protein ACJ8J0_20735 [Longimicrobiaceae bacterium]
MIAGFVVLLAGSLAISRMGPAAPVVDRATVWADTLRRGEMLWQVRGPGTLVAEDIRWISAVTQGRVEGKLVQPGTVARIQAQYNQAQRREVMELLAALHLEGSTICMVTHDPRYAGRAERTAQLFGRVLEGTGAGAGDLLVVHGGRA